jgi:tRNA-(ms[2]io[6]A)-hydroxylase
LPVLQQAAAEPIDDAQARPAWQWVVFGALAVFVVWLPLAAVTTGWLLGTGALGAQPVVRAALFASGLAVAGLAGGYLVGRWGTGGVGTREAGLAGLVAAAAAAAMAWSAAGLAGALVTSVIAVPCAALGGWLGVGRRAR